MSLSDIAFIGCGHMGAELARVAATQKKDILLANRTFSKASALAEELKARAVRVEEAAENARFLVLGVRPQNLDELMDTIRPILARRTDRFVLVSMLVGVTVEKLREKAGLNVPIIRIMPNTPVAVQNGVILYVTDQVLPSETDEFCRLFASGGWLCPVTEDTIDAAGCVSGCGPAYVYRFIDSFLRAGEALGLDRETALRLVLSTVSGSVRMVQETGRTPDELCRQVCSKGGTTEKGVDKMNEKDIDGLMQQALKASYLRTLELKN